ncbi:MAG: hypothetical protein ACPIOQ_73945 [Promethearchaeia archaeon]
MAGSSLLEETGQCDERAQQMYDKAMQLIQLHSPGMVDSDEGGGDSGSSDGACGVSPDLNPADHHEDAEIRQDSG